MEITETPLKSSLHHKEDMVLPISIDDKMFYSALCMKLVPEQACLLFKMLSKIKHLWADVKQFHLSLLRHQAIRQEV